MASLQKPHTPVTKTTAFILGITLAGVLALAATGHAASITWGAATPISGDADVLDTGTVVGAFNPGPAGVPSTTVNGVTFAPFEVPTDNAVASTTVGDFTFTYSKRNADSSFGSSSAPFSALPDPSYQTLLQSATGDVMGTGMTLTMNGLTPGQDYVFQWWSNDSGLNHVPAHSTTATSGTAVTLSDNTAGSAGGLGEYAIGTFTADGPSEAVTFTGVGIAVPLVNAFQLQEAAIPEPSTWTMLAAGGALFLARRRRAPSL